MSCVVQSIDKEVVHASLVENVKNTIVGTIRGTGEIVNAVTEAVMRTFFIHAPGWL